MGTLITMFGGFVFVKLMGLKGLFTALFIVWSGCSIGATLQFICSRYILSKSPFCLRMMREFEDYDQIYEVMSNCNNLNGCKLLILMRLIPWMPYNFLNASMASTNIKISQFMPAHIGSVPYSILFCFVGAFIDAISRMIYDDN